MQISDDYTAEPGYTGSKYLELQCPESLGNTRTFITARIMTAGENVIATGGILLGWDIHPGWDILLH